jgi:hypothetical protein
MQRIVGAYEPEIKFCISCYVQICKNVCNDSFSLCTWMFETPQKMRYNVQEDRVNDVERANTIFELL